MAALSRAIVSAPSVPDVSVTHVPSRVRGLGMLVRGSAYGSDPQEDQPTEREQGTGAHRDSILMQQGLRLVPSSPRLVGRWLLECVDDDDGQVSSASGVKLRSCQSWKSLTSISMMRRSKSTRGIENGSSRVFGKRPEPRTAR